jgi:NAD(P)H-flavin reductase
MTLDPVDPPLPAPAAGQFTMLTAFGVGEVPISVSSAAEPTTAGDRNGHTLVQTLRAVGAVTQALHDAKPGTLVGVRGPFGVGWDLNVGRGRDVVIVGGGVGLAPLRPVVRAVLAHRTMHGQVAVLVGARTPADLLYPDELEQIANAHVAISVDQPTDDWRGPVGVVTTLLAGAPFDAENTVAYVCGPEIMMRFTAAALMRRGVPADRIQISLERNMRCGVGLCGHCQLGPIIVCRDGPVVTYDRVAELVTVREL